MAQKAETQAVEWGVSFEEEVSIIAVPVGVRRKVLNIISDDLEYYEEHLVIT